MHALAPEQWLPLEASHHERVDGVVQPHLVRAQAGEKHPVIDFLFTYYRFSPAKLRRWHPGWRTALEIWPDQERLGWRHIRTRHNSDVSLAEVDVAGFVTQHARRFRVLRALLVATSGRSGQFGCFGLHEWAMVYRQPVPELRHRAWPLRLSPAETDGVVEDAQLRCTHFDAFRFFTPAATPRNTQPLSRASAIDVEQPGCLHAGMDLYRYASELTPLVPSDLVWDAFSLALQIRELDMQASPYDLSALGYEPVKIETASGRAEYVRLQKQFAERGQSLRVRLIAEIEALPGLLRDHSTTSRRSPASTCC